MNIYHDILEKGGRFLDQEGNVMDQNKALLKVMKVHTIVGRPTSDLQ